MKKAAVIFIVGVLVFIFLIYTIYSNNITRTRFALHALGRYIHAHNMIQKDRIENLSDLPDFHLVSPSYSLELRGADIKKRILYGYYYDFQLTHEGFVVSASPVRFLRLFPEFGILEDGNLRVNSHDVDADPDGYDEVKNWAILPEWYPLQTSS